jgi:hypothetical protein
VPSAWTRVTSGQLTLFTDGEAGINFEIESLAGLLDPQSVTQAFLSHLDPAPVGMTGTAHLGTVTTNSVPLSGLAWARTTADLTVTAAGTTVPWHAVVLVTQHGGSTFLVAYFAPSTLFTSEDATHFQVMLSSLNLSSTQP